jgi:hypothetical protein
MTLVNSMGVGGCFVAMTSDLRMVYQKYWYDFEKDSFEKADIDMEITDQIHEKVSQLTDYTLLGVGGTSELAIHIRDELVKRVTYENDLSDCAKILSDIVEEGRKNTDDIIMRFLDDDYGVCVIITGFYRDGASGQVSFSAGVGEQVNEVKAELGDHFYGIIPPALHYAEKSNELFKMPELHELDFEAMTHSEMISELVNIAVGHLTKIHLMISYYQQIEVSPDGHCHVLYKNEDGQLQYLTDYFDTSEHYELFNTDRRR